MKIYFWIFLVVNLFLNSPAVHSEELLNFNDENQEFNLGIEKIEKKEISQGLYFLRKYLYENPRDLEAYHAIEYGLSKLEFKNFQQETTFLKELNDKILKWLTAEEWLVLQLLCTLFLGFVFIRHLSVRKKIFSLGEVPPPFTNFHWVIIVTLIVVNFGCFAKLIFFEEELATLTVKGQKMLKSGPQVRSADLFDVYDGSELKIIKKYKDWSQVSFQDHAIGWIESKYLLVHKHKLWL